MESVTLEQVIRNYIPLPAIPSSKGWYHVLCKVCNDHGRKGNRGGFKFEGEAVGYNCFNCGHKATYDPAVDSELSPSMITVLNDFGVPKEEWQQVLFTNLKNRQEGKNKSSKTAAPINIEPKDLPVPESFYLLSEAGENDKWAIIARDYLIHDRKIDPSSYPFMLSSIPSDPKMRKWLGRLIIPIYKDQKLIFYQGRDLVGTKTKKYESPPVDKDKVLYGFGELFKDTDEPLYVCEGFFDAKSIGGVALLGNDISKAQQMWLNRSRRKKVYIPDQFGDGQIAAKRAIKAGWNVSTPDIGNCKDMNEAVNKYGLLYVMKTLADNTADGFTAQTNVSIYCKNKN